MEILLDMATFHRGDVNWPPRPYDLNPLDFWNYPKWIVSLKVKIQPMPSLKFSRIYTVESFKIESVRTVPL